MKNPWLKKNPFLSMWLSAANRIAGTARARTAAVAKRQTASFWADALAPPTPPKRKKRR